MLAVPSLVKGMSRSGMSVVRRTRAITNHMMSTASSNAAQEPPILFESNATVRSYILNRSHKLNALDEPMLALLRPKIEEWSNSDLCDIIVGSGVGRAFCAGGDVASVIQAATDSTTRSKAIDFFKREFEMDYILATLRKPYVAIMDGLTMGGGYGLAAHAPFRIATENTIFAMPETKIGYCPDVGASYFLSRLDGQLGTYFALTSDTLKGRAVFDLGLATHFIPSRRVPILLDRLAALEKAHPNTINNTIEEFSSERQPEEPPTPLTGDTREALDFAFRHDRIEQIVEDLQSFSQAGNPAIRQWATDTLAVLHLRSPTSLKVALKAIRKGKEMTLLEALDMELKIATAYCSGASPDFQTGVTAVLLNKNKKNGAERPAWSPTALTDVSDEILSRFFEPTSPYLSPMPQLVVADHVPSGTSTKHMRYALPTEEEIGSMVMGTHSSGGGTGIRLDELVEKFNDLRRGKLGVKEKVLEVARRKCEIVDNKDGNFVWLKWKHSPARP